MQLLPNADKFLIGCNYWSSQSGISMWRDQSESAIEQDLAALKDAGMNTVRIFPLWSDFQPVSWACGPGGVHVELIMPDGSEIKISINYADYAAGEMAPNEVKIENI